YEVLTGRLPFEAPTVLSLLFQHAHEPPPPPSRFCPDRAPFDAPIARALSKSPARRPPTCGALADELTAAGSAADTAATMIAVKPQSDRAGDRRVLVIDDDPAFVRFAARAAGFAFYGSRVRLEGAATGLLGIEQAQREPPHLVLLDYDMPGLDGVETLTR